MFLAVISTLIDPTYKNLVFPIAEKSAFAYLIGWFNINVRLRVIFFWERKTKETFCKQLSFYSRILYKFCNLKHFFF